MAILIEENLKRKTHQILFIFALTKKKSDFSKKTLFKFDKSSISNDDSSSATIKEHKRNVSDMSNDLVVTVTAAKSERRKILVCDPNPSLVRKLYLPIMNYIHQMETFMKYKSGQHSSLHLFLSGFVKDKFLAKGHNRTLQLTIESLAKNPDAWRAIITPEDIKSMGLSRPLLQSTVLFESRMFLGHYFLS